MTTTKMTIISSSGIHKNRPLKCPVCNKRKLYAIITNKATTDDDNLKRISHCYNCGYLHEHNL